MSVVLQSKDPSVGQCLIGLPRLVASQHTTVIIFLKGIHEEYVNVASLTKRFQLDNSLQVVDSIVSARKHMGQRSLLLQPARCRTSSILHH